MTLEYRDAIGEVRSVDDATRQVVARVCSFNAAPDTYRTTWKPGVFTESLRAQLPTVCWGHDQRNVIGSVIDYQEQPDGLDVTIQFANPDDVPQARAAYSLIKDGHIKGWSFGFADAKCQPDPQHRGAQQFTKATLYEVSPVVRASVPGTRTLAVRSDDGETREVSEATITGMIASQVAEAIATGTRAADEPQGEPTTIGEPPVFPEGTDWREAVAEVVRATLAEQPTDTLTPAEACSGCLERAAAAAADGDWATVRAELEAAGLFAEDLDDTTEAGDGGRAAEDTPAPDATDSGERAAVSDKPWSDFTEADYTPEQWKRACLIVTGDGSTKDDGKLPIREPDGTLNRNGVHAAAARLGQTQASAQDKQAAAKKLMSAYSTLGEKPPGSVLALASGRRDDEDLDIRAAEALARIDERLAG